MLRTRYTKTKIIIILIAIALVGWFFYSFLNRTKQREVSAISVTSAYVKQQDVTIKAHAIGSVQPYVTVSVKSRVDGQLLKVDFKEGDFVKEGQVILEIDPRPFQVALQQAEATLIRDQAQLDNYKQILSRYTALANKGYVSKQDFDQANANVKAQAALVLADEAAVANAKLNLEYCTIRAPLSGRTGNLLVNRGNLVKATDTNSLVVINQIQPIYISFSLPQQHLAPILEEMRKKTVPVNILMKNPSKRLKATLNFIDNTVDTTTGMIQLKAVYPNQKEELWPGLYVDVSIPIYEIKNALLIPTRAIQASPEGSFVFVINANSQVNKKMISAGPQIKDNTVIEGLEPNTQVVTTGQTQLIDGTRVRISSLESAT